MRFKIIHDTQYNYESAVFLEPHYFRFRPRTTSYLTRESFNLSIDAKPSGRREMLDEEGNVVEFSWFSGLTQKLTIRAESTVLVKTYNPLDFILHPSAFNTLPLYYNQQHINLLHGSLQQEAISGDLIAYGDRCQAQASYNTVQYLTQLTSQINVDFNVIYREVGSPMSPDMTFELKEGSCRDLSWMMINLLRHQGIAARFTSGYFYLEMEESAYELHAWVEVFLPGSGWLGLDPSNGMVAGNTHFPIASSAHYDNTMPVSGEIRGSAESTLSTQLSIKLL